MSEPHELIDEGELDHPLDLFLELNPHFEGFTVKEIETNGEDILVLTLAAGDASEKELKPRKYAERHVVVHWDEEEELLLFSLRARTRVPKEAYGWLLMFVNLFHSANSPTISRVFVEPPEQEDDLADTLHIQCNWSLSDLVSHTADVVNLLRDNLEWLYHEAQAIEREVNKQWRKAGKA